MKHKVVIKIVATGGETTWLLVCYSALFCSFYVTEFLLLVFQQATRNPPAYIQVAPVVPNIILQGRNLHIKFTLGVCMSLDMMMVLILQRKTQKRG